MRTPQLRWSCSASIRHWWQSLGRRAYPQATDLCITADADGPRTLAEAACAGAVAPELFADKLPPSQGTVTDQNFTRRVAARCAGARRDYGAGARMASTSSRSVPVLRMP